MSEETSWGVIILAVLFLMVSVFYNADHQTKKTHEFVTKEYVGKEWVIKRVEIVYPADPSNRSVCLAISLDGPTGEVKTLGIPERHDSFRQLRELEVDQKVTFKRNSKPVGWYGYECQRKADDGTILVLDH